MRRLRLACVLALVVLLLVCSSAMAGITRHDVLVIANSNSPASMATAEYYRIKRSIPASHVRTISCSTEERVLPSEFVSIRDQIKAHLLSLGSVPDSPESDPISTIVLCTGVPHIASDNGECYSAVDSALAGCFTESSWGKEPLGVYGDSQPSPGFPNPYYGAYCSAMPFEQMRANAALSTSLEAFPDPGFTIVRMLDDNTALAAGGAGLLFRGTRSDGGWTWSPVAGKDKAFIGWRVSCISVLDSTHAYACTGNETKPHGGGTIIATSDAGLTWTRLRSSSRGTGWKLVNALASVDFADTLHGWAVGTTQTAYGAIKAFMISTSNGGSNWQDLSSKLPASFFPRAVAAADANNVWICGAAGAIYHSDDGGDTWSLANAGAPAVDYSSIWIESSSGAFRGWAAGESGKIVRTEDGSNWSVQAGGLTSSNITDLAVYDADRACAAYGGTSFLSYSAGVWIAQSVGLAPVVSAAASEGGDYAAVGGTRYIFAHSGTGWAAVYSGTDTPWRLRYMVTRLDGYAEDADGDGLPDDVKAIIDRASAPASSGKFVIDETTKLDSGQTITANQFKPVDDALAPIVGTANITWDKTTTFLTHQTGVMGYLSWGLHDYYANTFTTLGRPFNSWANGGIGVVIESTDGRGFSLPYFAWALYGGGTTYANKLSASGWWNSSTYVGFRMALKDAAGNELASGVLSGGSVQIDLTNVNWPADHKTYVEVYFPSNDPLHPGQAIEHARYPWSGTSTEVYNARTTGFPLAFSLARNMLAEMLREGASGGMANVDEPWSNYIGDPTYLFPRYAQGYTFAESAYMCLPGLGWQEVAVGDPMMAPYATAPVVAITAPSVDGQIVTGTVRFSASATPKSSPSIAKVEFWLDDDTLLVTDTTAPYYVDMDTTAIADGVHRVEAVAYENDSVQNTGSASRSIISNNTGSLFGSVNGLFDLPDGSTVGLQGATVSAAFNGMFYVQSADRSRGIRVRSATPVSEGNTVIVVGKLRTIDGEREIVADGVY